MTSGSAAAPLARPIVHASDERLESARDAVLVVGVQRQQRFTGAHGVARLGVHDRHRHAACTGSSLRARPAPSRQAATPTARASSRSRTPDASATTSCRSRAVGSDASGSPPCAAIMARHTSIARPSRSTSAGSVSSRSAAASISRASATVSSTTSAGPPPAEAPPPTPPPPARYPRSAPAACPSQ